MKPLNPSIVFTKMHVSGNDFLVMNGLVRELSVTESTIRQLGDRRVGIGFDQLIVINRAENHRNDAAIQFFNQDGSESGQCGNGCAAVAAFLHQHRLNHNPTLQLESSRGLTECEIIHSERSNRYTVCVNLGVPRLQPKDVPFLHEKQQVQYELNIRGQDQPVLLSVLSLGNPHAVIVVPNVAQVPLDEIGPEIQQHESFPHSTNVEVVEIQNDRNGVLRIFERGVGETLNCGTGAAAAMVAGRLLDAFHSTVTITTPGGSTIVKWEGPNHPVEIRCEPSFVFTGTWTQAACS